MPKPDARWGSLPFAEQIAFFKDKIDLPTERWQDLLGSAHDRAFVVAGAMRADLLADLHAAVLKSIEQGTTLETFRKDFKAIVAKRGWTGWTGEDSPEGVAWRTKTIYGTNLRTSYQAGRHAQAQAIAHRRPYWRYVHNATVLDPRPEHVAWHGIILRAGDPWFSKRWPPSGWGCRCRIETLSQRDLERLGKSGPDPTPDDGTYEWLDKRTGQTHTIPKGIDPGWDYTPGATRDLIAEVKAKAAGLPPKLGEALINEVSAIKALDTSANGAILDSKRGGIQQASTAGDKPMNKYTKIDIESEMTRIAKDEERTTNPATTERAKARAERAITGARQLVALLDGINWKRIGVSEDANAQLAQSQRILADARQVLAMEDGYNSPMDEAEFKRRYW